MTGCCGRCDSRPRELAPRPRLRVRIKGRSPNAQESLRYSLVNAPMAEGHHPAPIECLAAARGIVTNLRVHLIKSMVESDLI